MEVEKSSRPRGRPRKRNESFEICQRCGNIGSPVIMARGEREYIYMYHYNSEKKAGRLCYIGPRDEYIAIQKVHQQAYGDAYGLSNLMSNDLALIALQAVEILKKRVHKMGAEEKRVRLEHLSEIIRVAREAIEEIEKSMEEEKVGAEEVKVVDLMREASLDADMLRIICRDSPSMKISPSGLVKLLSSKGLSIDERRAERFLKRHGEYNEVEMIYVVKCK